MQFVVRRAAIGDEAELRAVRLQALSDSPQAFSSTYERELARTAEDWRRWVSSAATFLLQVDGQVRGLVAGVPDAHNSSLVDLRAMWVHPECRGTGAADLLVSAVKDWAAETGATQVRLNVVESNVRARRCYERLGFHATGLRIVNEHSGLAEIEMNWHCSQ